MIPRLARPFDVTIRPPGSKSITNRALLLAALAEGESVLRGALVDAEDARVMIRALEQLGASIVVEQSADDAALGNATLRVTGVGGRWKPREREPVLDLHNAGTATRFLTAAALVNDPAAGPVTIDGNARMRERPIGELVDVLRVLGARVEYVARVGFPPVRVYPIGADRRREVVLGRTSSGQFVSALLMIAPMLPGVGGVGGLAVRLPEPPTSEPYVRMTLRLLERVGVRTDGSAAGSSSAWTTATTWRFERQPIKRFDVAIEPDFSGAVPFWCAAAMVPGASCAIDAGEGFEGPSLQGDAQFLEHVLGEFFGAEWAWEDGGRLWRCRGVGEAGGIVPPSLPIGLGDVPDTAMAAAVMACFASGSPGNAEGVTTLAGLRTLRVKETDRLAALQAELSKIGAGVEVVATAGDEALQITPPRDLSASPVCLPASVAPPPVVEFETYDDHRMAMALALIGLRRGNVVVRDPGCVRKTYSAYWRDFARLYGLA